MGLFQQTLVKGMLEPMGHLSSIEPEYLTAKEVKELLRISSATLYRWLKSETFPAGAKFGSNRVWKASVIRQWAADQELT